MKKKYTTPSVRAIHVSPLMQTGSCPPPTIIDEGSDPTLENLSKRRLPIEIYWEIDEF